MKEVDDRGAGRRSEEVERYQRNVILPQLPEVAPTGHRHHEMHGARVHQEVRSGQQQHRQDHLVRGDRSGGENSIVDVTINEGIDATGRGIEDGLTVLPSEVLGSVLQVLLVGSKPVARQIEKGIGHDSRRNPVDHRHRED